MGNVDDLAAQISTDAWHSASFFGEAVAFFKEGKSANKQELTGVFQPYSLGGTNETRGDGATLNEKGGRKERQSYSLSLPVSANVSFPQKEGRPDIVRRESDGTLFVVKRILAEDSAEKLVLVTRTGTATHRESSRQG